MQFELQHHALEPRQFRQAADEVMHPPVLALGVVCKDHGTCLALDGGVVEFVHFGQQPHETGNVAVAEVDADFQVLNLSGEETGDFGESPILVCVGGEAVDAFLEE